MSVAAPLAAPAGPVAASDARARAEAPAPRVGVDRSVAVPLLLVHVVALGLAPFTFTWAGLVACSALYLFTGFGVTAGAHRLHTHRTYTPRPILREILSFAFLASAQGSIQRWVRDHAIHHRHTDDPGDPHSPVRDGLFHAHVGWLWKKPPSKEEARALYARFTAGLEPGWVGRRLGSGPGLVALHLGVAGLAWAVGATLEAGLTPGALVTGWRTGLSVVTWGVALRIVLVMHSTFLVNSVAHRYGYRNHPTPDDSRNHAGVALVALGEGWHNNHHARPAAANNGFHRWWEVDLTFLLLVALGAVGLLSDLHVWRADKGRMERWFRARPTS